MAPGASGKWHVLYPARSEGEVLDDAVQFRMGRPDGWNVPLHAVWHGQSLSLDRPRCRSGLSLPDRPWPDLQDRKSTRLNSSHTVISYAVFCLKKKKKTGEYPSKYANPSLSSVGPP